MNGQRVLLLTVLALGAVVAWVDGVFFPTTVANGALTFTIPTLTATTGTAALALGGLGALGAGLVVGALLAKSLNRPQQDNDDGYVPVSSGYSSHSSSGYSTPHHSSSYKAPSSDYGKPHHSSSYKAPSSGYGHKHRRQGRSIHGEIKPAQEDLVTINLEPVFKSLEENDVNDCAKMKVCVMGTKEESNLAPQELALLVVFGEQQPIPIASAKASYDLAFRLGRGTKKPSACHQRYSKCQET